MTSETHQLIRRKMTDCGAWNRAINMKVYTTQEFVSEFGTNMPSDLIHLLDKNVSKLQVYMDQRILVPRSKD